MINWKNLILIGLICLFAIVIFKRKHIIIPDKNKQVSIKNDSNIDLAEQYSLSEFNPYTGEQNIEINPITSLNGMTLKDIADFRTQKVNEHIFLNLFPVDYDPLKEPHSKIYGSITSGADWLEPAQFYICNPYLLIVLTCATHVTPLSTACNSVEVKYSNGTIEESYEGDDALRWFEMLYSYDDYPGIIRIWMVNAFDCGLFYANVDINKSVNIDSLWSASPVNIINSIYSNSGFFHVGKYKVNNLSPADPKGRIKLINRDIYTSIYVKLWRKKPDNKDLQEDFAYIIKIMP